MVRVRYSFSSRHTGKIKNIRRQKQKFPSVMKHVITISEILLEILDARFIEETRNREIENFINKKGKKIIFVINKSDLVDEKSLVFSKDLRPFIFISAKTGKGAKKLREKIKIEAKRTNIGNKKRVQIGIIGYPNVGKSSIINLITRKGLAKTSKQAGFTKGMQKIRLTDNILIIDTPGVITESKYLPSNRRFFSEHAKLGARTYSDVKDPEYAVNYIMENNSKAIEDFYNINAEGNSEILIEQLGKRKNLLKKGGEIDVDRTARVILKDWQEGKIKIK